ncbi:MAG: Glycosyl transferase family 2 [Candidatus Moranbacteria bacterium GW2011_GWC2_37_73]|nr:MAG: glycosyl transferase family 2 [Parcubacteria group bacterium GW2011_GWC1_36_108]KKQ01269.1 MAG: Glycosyl transferase family 2 [Candidatus Moranbacteria bacterium GW2011_GWD1_36_198]KKQ02328.1 MAG: Glycosyl transferase family 2 [Candidatus Moranbacteria bacterium GW2011_GWD2_36_198]KKQ40223.1 MAG: Glycosyl transferase family 2 [Candidatus Moranbacteria bacterium GW2011_GWC2_37_73]HAR99723.1 glycosyltransferase family 2 protein [Candidatus Moranbacteria bacterium]
MRLIVNLPAFNEEEKIAETIKSIPRTIKGIDEVLVQVIDDGSKDQTATKAKEAGADFVFSHKVNRGLGITFRTATEKALENGADIMVNIDADGQFNPNDISKIIEPILNGEVDMTSADRFGKHKAKNMPAAKYYLNRFAAWIIGWFMNYPIKDLTCGFRGYNKETLLRLNLPGAFTYTQEVIIDALGKNLKIKWIPVEVTYFEGRKSRVVRSIYKYVNNSAKIILKAVRDVRPMKFFGVPGLFLIIISLAVFGYFIMLYFQEFKISPYRNYLIFSISSFLIGLQFLVFALIADMIKSSRKLTEDQMYMMKVEKYKR